MFTIKSGLTSATLALFAALSSPAFASTLNVEPANGSLFADENGQNNWRIVTQFSVDNTQYGRVYAGAFRLTSDAGGLFEDFLAFCLEPLEALPLPKEYMYGSKFTQTVNDNLNALAVNAWDAVTDSKSAAAFQMAAWEITTETADRFDIDTGNFAITYGSANSNTSEALAQGWLDNIDNGVWTADGPTYQILNTTGAQDLLTNVAAVPLPASGLFLLGGLFGTGFVARRQKRKA